MGAYKSNFLNQPKQLIGQLTASLNNF